MALSTHDAFRFISSQNVAYAVSGGSSAASSAFGAQTRWIRVVATGVVDVSNNGCRIIVGDGTPVAVATSTLLPLNRVQEITVTPGQKIAVLGNTAATGNLNVTELS
jgi:hypothetical protein